MDGIVQMTHMANIGNRCGHKCVEPRFYHPQKPSAIDILQKAQANCSKFYFNYGKDKILSSLINSRISSRKIRSEGRERTIAMIQVLLQYCDLTSMRVGVPRKDSTFWSPSMKWLAEKAGFRRKEDPEEKGIKRTWRAINDLVEAGYLEVHQRFIEYGDELNQYKGLAAIRKISKKLFIELGISIHKLERNRKSASKRLKRIITEHINQESIKKVRGAIESLGKRKMKAHSQRLRASKKQKIKTYKLKAIHADKQRQLIQEALRIAKLEGKTPTEVFLTLRNQA